MKVPLMAELTALTLLCCPSAHARDYGQQGTVFRVIETDLLASIKARLETMAANGTMERINRDLKDRTVARVNRPQPVEGLVAATTPRTWLFDPSISVADDIRDTQGQILVAAGTRVNPLDTVPLRQPLLFFNGDDADERRWAMAERQKGAAKLILVKGAPLAVMKAEQTRVYFDQSGLLVRRFGIKATPARVIQQARQLQVSEVALKRGMPGARP